MGLSPNMKMAVRRVADVLGAYARLQGWWPQDFRLYYRADEKWGKIHFIFVSDGFEGRDETESYRSIMDYVSVRIHDDPDLVDALGLVLRSFNKMREGGIYSIGQSYSFIRPRDLVKRAIREVGDLAVKYAKDQGWLDSDYLLFYRVDATSGDRIKIRLAAPTSAGSSGAGSLPFDVYVKSRLFDEPDILSTFDLEVTASVDPGEVSLLEKAGYREYFTIYRSLIP